MQQADDGACTLAVRLVSVPLLYLFLVSVPLLYLSVYCVCQLRCICREPLLLSLMSV